MKTKKILSALKDCDKPNLKHTRHKISKKDVEEYFNNEDEEEE